MTDRASAAHGAGEKGGSYSKVVAVLLAVQFAFASWAIVGKVTLGVVPPLALTTLRLVGGAVAFGALSLASGRSIVAPRGERLEVVRLALAGLVINQLCFTWGLARTSAIETTLLVATIPVFSALFAVLTGAERASRAIALGICCAMAGVVLVARPWRSSNAQPHLVGDLLVLANSASYAMYLVRGRAMFARHGAFAVLGWIFPVAALCVLPLGLPELARTAGSYSAQTWVAITYVVLGPTVFAYAGNAYALARAPSSLVAAFIYVQPALAVIMAVAFGDALARWLSVPPPREKLELVTVGGLVAILAGVWIATRREAPSATPPADGAKA
ncbi:MAG: DMT family transporter [Myxococcales bacterium]|nr:DMT family transporter [Myxococcales bacterium]